MGRARSFDEHAAIRSARAVFWRRGYEAASLPELEEATGLNRSSIYHAFGSKRALFDAAVENYLDEVIRPRLVALTTEPVAPDAVDSYLVGMRDAILAPDSPAASHGCLLVNAAGSPIVHDTAVRERVAAYRDEIASALTRGLSASRPTQDPESLASTANALTALVVAAMTLTRVDPLAAAETLNAARRLAAGEASGVARG